MRTHQLSLLADLLLLLVCHGLVACDADVHVLLCFKLGNEGFCVLILDVFDNVGWNVCICSEHTTNGLFTVECCLHCNLSTKSESSDEELVGAASHESDLGFDHLFDACFVFLHPLT